MRYDILKLLIFPGGTEIGLEIKRALMHLKDIQIYSGGMDVSNPAPYAFTNHFILPGINSTTCIESLNKIISKYGIDYIFPAHDDVVVELTKQKKKVKAKIISSPYQTCRITRSKAETYRFFAGRIPMPTLYDDVDSIAEYPVFIKPDKGQGSQDVHIAHDSAQALMILRDKKDFIVTEYLAGEEYTIDCFSDRDKGLLFCGGRQRVRISRGISMNSRIVNDPIFEKYAKIISEAMTFHGAWFFQVKKNNHGTYKLLEIAPRIAGTMALNRVRGVNFPLLSIYEQERIPVSIFLNDINVEIDRALTNSYKHKIEYRTVYLDLDDTIIIKNRVNPEIMRFLFQCINKNVRLVLLTKHADDLKKTLKKYRLTDIFDEIIHISHGFEKSNYIKETDAIFIDDSFSERRAVADKCGILTFDLSMLELLVDEKA